MRNLVFAILLTLFGDVYQALLPNYVAEVYFVIDKRVVDNYMKESNQTSIYAQNQQAIASIKADVNYFIAELNHLYSSMSAYGLNIEIRSRQLDILNSDLFTGSEIKVSDGLKLFDNWLFGQGSYHNLGYDLAVLWTGHELVGSGGPEDDGTAGYAHVAGVCTRERASTIVEFDGTYHAVVVTAHEIGHLLGADHDIIDKGYIMAPLSSADSAHRWTFTSASASAIKGVLAGSSFSTSCLRVTNPASEALSGPVTSALVDPDVICQRSTGSQDSFMCKDSSMYENSVPQGDAVCTDIYCKDTRPNRGDSCRAAFSSDGLTCGANKVCRAGNCQYDAKAGTANINVNCIWGDLKRFKISVNNDLFEGTCPEFIEKHGKTFCSYKSVSEPCCKTCNSLTERSAAGSDCPYGDQKTLRLNINAVPFSGSCSLLIAQYGQDLCNHASIKSSCCGTCASRGSRSLLPRSRSLSLSTRSRLNARLSNFFGFTFRGIRSTSGKVEVLPNVVKSVKYSIVK